MLFPFSGALLMHFIQLKMTAATEERGRKVWLKVRCDGAWRKVEWNTANSSFEELEKKVKTLFHLDHRVKKLGFKYIDEELTNITMVRLKVHVKDIN